MTTYLLRRLVQSVVVVIGVTLLAFVSLHMAGDPTHLYVNERASQEEFDAVRKSLGFDRPLPEQYLTYLGRLVRGDMGDSLRSRLPALPMVMDRLPATMELTMFSLIISIGLSIPIGIIAAMRRGTPVDGGIMLLAIFGQSMPSFWLGIMLILFVGLGLKDVVGLPISGHVPILEPILAGDFTTAVQNFPNAIRYLILPGFTIAAFSLSRNARLVRSSMLEILSQDYVTTARAKGLRERTVVSRHALRNALIPIVTVLGLEFGFLLSGVVVTETVFSWPGVGRLVFNAISQRDIPVVQASVVLFALLFVVINLLVDVMYLRLDPRIRLN